MQKLKIERPRLSNANELKFKEASLAYGEGNYDKAYKLTLEILKSQDFEEVKRLNKKALLRRSQ